MKLLLTLACLFAVSAVQSTAAVLTFEGVASPSNLVVNVSPTNPYIEAGFTLTPTNENSAVFSASSGPQFPGDGTDYFGFALNNTITLTGPVPFNFTSALIGRSPTAGTGITSFTFTGTLVGGGTVTAIYGGISNAVQVNPNFSNLQSVTFSATSNAAIDNITVNASTVPEPSTTLISLSGCTGLLVLTLRKGRNQKFSQ